MVFACVSSFPFSCVTLVCVCVCVPVVWHHTCSAAEQQVENNPALVEMKETMLREAHYRYISLFSRTIASVGVMYESANVARARHLVRACLKLSGVGSSVAPDAAVCVRR